jgi:hypothetical protein
MTCRSLCHARPKKASTPKNKVALPNGNGGEQNVTITIGRGVGWLCGTQTNSDQGNVRKNDRLYNASVTLVTDRKKAAIT